MIFKVLALFGFLSFLALVKGDCDTAILPKDRISCNPDTISQSACQALGCVWCSNTNVLMAQCFINKTTNYDVMSFALGNCNSITDCDVKVNCYPDVILSTPNQAECEARSCLWLGTSAADHQPRCVYYNVTSLASNYFDSGVVPLLQVAGLCATCSTCTYKQTCLPNESNVNENRCERENCLWCDGECIIGQTNMFVTGAPDCTSCYSCPYNAYLKVGSSQTECTTRGGTWCSNRESTPDDRRCILLHDYSSETCSVSAIGRENCNTCTDCDTAIDCSSVSGTNETKASCEELGCIWCTDEYPLKPLCRYGSKGYRCTDDDHCEIQFPRFQRYSMYRKSGQKYHITKLLEVLCYSQLGLWIDSSSDKCVSPFPLKYIPAVQDFLDNV